MLLMLQILFHPQNPEESGHGPKYNNSEILTLMTYNKNAKNEKKNSINNGSGYLKKAHE